MFAFVVLDSVFQYLAKRLAGKNVSEISGVAKIWCQEGHMQKLLGFYRKQMLTYSRCQTLYRSKCTEKN